MTTIIAQKRCTKCGETKSVSEFGKDKLRIDGLFPQCKRCRWRNPEKREESIEKQKQGLRRCPACKEWLSISCFGSNKSTPDGKHTACAKCSREQVKKYYAENIDKVRARDKAYRDANPDLRSFFWKRYYENNEDKLTIKSHAARKNRSSQPDTLTGMEWREIIGKQNNSCGKCKRKFSKDLPPTRDHIVPLSKGGLLTKENCQALCRACNTSKGTKIIDYRDSESL